MDQYARVDLGRLAAAAQPLLEAFPGDIWLAHQIIERPNGQLDKPPAPGFRSNDPTTWCTLGAAAAIAEGYPSGTAGVGFAITAGMITFDFDNCVTPDGTVVAGIAALIEQLNSFTYTTVSGTGMRVVCRNDKHAPIPAGKFTVCTPDGGRFEVFVGPCNFFNTFSPATNGKRIAERAAAVRELFDALDAHERQRGAASSNIGDLGRTSDLGKRARNPEALIAALKFIPHDEHVDRALWVKIGGAVYAAMDGSERGRRAFVRWSETWHRHDEDPEGHTQDAEALWDSFTASPPHAVGAGTVFKLAKQHGWPGAQKSAAADCRVYQRFSEVQITPARDFVEDLLESDSVVVVYGPPGAGKTFFVLDLLLHVAWGRKWFGRDIEQGPALLYALEGRRGVERRIAAFRQHYWLKGKELPFRFSSDPVDLTNDDSVDALIKSIRRQAREFGAPIKIVAIDTLAAALSGNGDENSPEVMNPVLANCHRIRELTGGCCLILVHHPGKNASRGPRGFSGIGGTVSTLIEIEHSEPGKSRRVIIRKQRDLDLSEDMFYRLKVVELGVDPRRGKPITSCVVVPMLTAAERATADVQTKLAKLTPQQRLALDALHEALREHGLDPIDGKPAERVTNEKAWREAFRERFPADAAAETIKKAFQRTREALLAARLVGMDRICVWLTD